MISLDSNILFAAFNPRDVHHYKAEELLTRHSDEGLVICAVVYAELMASSSKEAIRIYLEEADISVLEELPLVVWERAGEAFGHYAKERRKGVLPRRIVADFLIAAHAEFYGLDIMTFDETIYKAVFPKLKLVK